MSSPTPKRSHSPSAPDAPKKTRAVRHYPTNAAPVTSVPVIAPFDDVTVAPPAIGTPSRSRDPTTPPRLPRRRTRTAQPSGFASGIARNLMSEFDKIAADAANAASAASASTVQPASAQLTPAPLTPASAAPVLAQPTLLEVDIAPGFIGFTYNTVDSLTLIVDMYPLQKNEYGSAVSAVSAAGVAPLVDYSSDCEIPQSP